MLCKPDERPHWAHDQLKGVVRLANISHATERHEWDIGVEEEAAPPSGGPQCMPAGMPLPPMLRIAKPGEEQPTSSRLNERQQLLFTKYAPKLAQQLADQMYVALQRLHRYVGDTAALH